MCVSLQMTSIVMSWVIEEGGEDGEREGGLSGADRANTMHSNHGQISSQSYKSEPYLDCNNTSPIDLAQDFFFRKTRIEKTQKTRIAFLIKSNGMRSW